MKEHKKSKDNPLKLELNSLYYYCKNRPYYFILYPLSALGIIGGYYLYFKSNEKSILNKPIKMFLRPFWKKYEK